MRGVLRDCASCACWNYWNLAGSEMVEASTLTAVARVSRVAAL